MTRFATVVKFRYSFNINIPTFVISLSMSFHAETSFAMFLGFFRFPWGFVYIIEKFRFYKFVNISHVKRCERATDKVRCDK